jgi:hypothetical protein
MTIAYLKKLPGGFIPEITLNEPDVFNRVKIGEVIKVEFSKPRNTDFHKKYFALLNIGYDAFEPRAEHKGVTVEKNFELFRKDVTIQAGFYTVTVNLNGELRLIAKSISFASMGEAEFTDLYEKTINVILQKVLTNYTRPDLDHVVEQVIRF